MNETGTVLMVVRLALQAGAGALVARGIGDQGLYEVLIGAVMSAGAGVWSYVARKQALASVPGR